MKKFREYDRYINEKLRFFRGKFQSTFEDQKYERNLDKKLHEFERDCKILQRRMRVLREKFAQIPDEDIDHVDLLYKKLKDQTVPNLILFIELTGKK